MQLRHDLFDKLLVLVFKICNNNIIESIMRSKHYFKEVFTDMRSGPQFEVSICFDVEGVLATDPTLPEHRESFEAILSNIEGVLFLNKDYKVFLKALNGLQFEDSKLWDLKELFLHDEMIFKWNKMY